MVRGQTYISESGIEIPIKQLWNDFVQSGRPAGPIRRMIIEHYVHLLFEYAGRLAPKYLHVDPGELISPLYECLEKRVDSFNPYRGVKFETYVSPAFNGAVKDYLREVDEAPRLQRTRAKRYQELEWESLVCRVISRDRRDIGAIIKEKAEEHGIGDGELNEMIAAARTIKTTKKTLRIVNREDDEGDYELDTTQVHQPNEPLTSEDEDYFLRILACYPNARKRALAFFYLFEDQSMKQVGALTDLSESRISQILTDIAWFFLDYLHKDLGGLPPSVFRKANVKYGDLDGLYECIHKNKIDVANGIKSLLMKVSYTKEDDGETKAPPEISPQRADQLKTLLGRLKSALNQG